MKNIREVTTRRELNAFVQFPKSLYRDCPYYVPPLDKAEKDSLTKHPALAFCDLKLWLAYDGDRIVGRIAGIINRKCNQLKSQRRVRFAWFDTVEDLEVAQLLVQTVADWGKQNGMTEMSGPSRYSNMDKQSLLVEGFDVVPTIANEYNFPYYPLFLEQLGFAKEVDYVQYKIKIGQVPEIIERLEARVRERQQVHIRNFRSKRELWNASRKFFKVINESYEHIYNFVPLTDAEIDWVVRHDFSLPKLDLISVLENAQGEMIGISFCMPTLSGAFQKAQGRLFPFGWMHVLRAMRKNNSVDLFLTGVLPEYANSGVHVLYHKQIHKTALANHYSYAYTSQQLEENPASRIWSRYGGELCCRRRCYCKPI